MLTILATANAIIICESMFFFYYIYFATYIKLYAKCANFDGLFTKT